MSNLHRQQTSLRCHLTNPQKTVSKPQEASYCASLQIAHACIPHTVGEELLLPLAKEMAPLSNKTVTHIIADMSDIRQMLIALKQSRSQCHIHTPI